MSFETKELFAEILTIPLKDERVALVNNQDINVNFKGPQKWMDYEGFAYME